MKPSIPRDKAAILEECKKIPADFVTLHDVCAAMADSPIDMNSSPRWLISITDMPLPCQSSISAAARSSTSRGNTAGPALKLKTFIALLPR